MTDLQDIDNTLENLIDQNEKIIQLLTTIAEQTKPKGLFKRLRTLLTGK